ncbi:hypothetical protein OF83DRAFT_1293625 [Amylostereum chailletii]|nr:hypothetical protein OF83DRAFT_1293625 [Amylostereum chailletii]
MSFSFQWPRFSEQFHADAIEMLNAALNKGTKPPIIADKIEVVELEMGTQPPDLEIRDIGDLTMDQFRGIFRLTYAGDAHLVLRTKVQANPLNHKQPDIHLMTGSRGMLAAKKALVVPMLLRLSHFRLSSYVVLVVSKQKGITLVFKTDPLQNVDINSTFDSIAVIQSFIQREIEGQLRQMFREDLPGIIHRLSQQWVKAKVEAPYLNQPRPPPPPSPRARDPMSMSAPDLTALPRYQLPPGMHQSFTPGMPFPYPRPRVSSTPSNAGTTRSRRTSSSLRHETPAPAPEPPETSFPDIENFDPTYGLRPEGLPTKSVFGSFGRLFSSPARGLADLAEESGEEEDDGGFSEGTTYDAVDWEDTIPDYASMSSAAGEGPDDLEYETIPAVGGGTITRPRVFHSLSQIHPPTGVALSPSRAPSEASTSRLTISTALRRPSSLYNPYFPPMGMSPTYMTPSSAFSPFALDARLRTEATPPTPPLYRSPPRRTVSPTPSTHTHPSHSSSHTHSLPTPPSSDSPASPVRHASTSYNSRLDTAFAPWPASPTLDPTPDDPKIVLRPTLNSSISQLSSLSHSNHTLSPYTRVPEHFAVRSGTGGGAGARGARDAKPTEVRAVHAKRRRLHVLGKGKGKGKGKDKAAPIHDDEALRRTGSTSPIPPSEFDAEDMDRYFRARDESQSEYEHSPLRHPHLLPHARPPDTYGAPSPPPIRRRQSYRDM